MDLDTASLQQGSTQQHGGLSRRALIAGGAALAVAGGMTPLFRRGLGELAALWALHASEIPMGIDDLSIAYRRARRRGKPLLVRLPEAGDDGYWLMRDAFTDLIERGEDHDRVPLALCEHVQAKFSAVAGELGAPALLRGSQFLLVETAGARPEHRALGVSLDAGRPRRSQWVRCWPPAGRARRAERLEEQRQQQEAELPPERKARCQRLARAIAKAIAPDYEALSRRARAASDALAPHEREAVAQALAQGRLPEAALCQRAAALLALAGARAPDPAQKERCVRALAAAAIAGWQ